MVGGTRCPGTRRTTTISFDRHGLLGPHSAYMTVDSSAAAVFLEMSASSTPYSAAAMIIIAAIDARPWNPKGRDRDFFNALCASWTRFVSSGPVPLLGCMRTPIPNCLNSCSLGSVSPFLAPHTGAPWFPGRVLHCQSQRLFHVDFLPCQRCPMSRRLEHEHQHHGTHCQHVSVVCVPFH